MRVLGLWGALYLALWLVGLALAALVGLAREGLLNPWPLAGWGIALGLMAVLACDQRLPLQDLLMGLNGREKLLLWLMLGAVFLAPVFLEGHLVLRDGFLWVAPMVLFQAVTPQRVRIFLAVALAGAWMAALALPPEPAGLVLMLGFGLAWLLALGAIHFAWSCEPHGLEGWWPLFRLGLGTLATALPAALAGYVAWLTWPEGGLHRPVALGEVAVEALPRAARRGLDELELYRLFYHLVMAGLMILGLLAIMWLARRLRSRRGGSRLLPGMVAAETATLEYRAARPPAAPPRLDEARAGIVRLWGRWADAMAREGISRQPGETAREFNQRLAREQAGAETAPEMVDLLERAHYGAVQPTAADLERMRELVAEELSRQGLRRQAPVEPVE